MPFWGEQPNVFVFTELVLRLTQRRLQSSANGGCTCTSLLCTWLKKLLSTASCMYGCFLVPTFFIRAIDEISQAVRNQPWDFERGSRSWAVLVSQINTRRPRDFHLFAIHEEASSRFSTCCRLLCYEIMLSIPANLMFFKLTYEERHVA